MSYASARYDKTKRQNRGFRQGCRGIYQENGAIPSFKGYMGFPATLCVSPNSVVVHGTPGESRLEEGDIVSIDGCNF